MKLVSVVIVNLNGERYLKACLDSIMDQKAEFEVLVVDDGSTDKSIKIIEEYKQVQLIKLRQNQGPAKARNRGVEKSKGKFILFLDVDTEVKTGAITKLAKRLEGDKQIGAVQARLDTRGHFLSWWGLPYEIDQPRKIIFGGRTAGLAVRREVFDKIGGFDEDYVIYGEDTDLCWRIWLAGFRVELVDEAEIKHSGRSSFSSTTKQRIYYEGSKNSLSNLIKNADGWLLIWMLPLYFTAWVVIWLKLTLSGRWSEAGAVWAGWSWNGRHLFKTLAKRRQVVRVKHNQCRQIMFGPLSMSQIIRKGLRWLSVN